ncbi:MAG TPA: STAS domain-containing protein [Armatimonadetes bacterium]|jgi:anti-anti-sigma factor|nr:STAS domain-containing protein [Armatimonadota bacterium]
MAVRARRIGTILEVECEGDCDLDAAPAMESAISRAARLGVRLLLIDLSRTRTLDSSGVRMLLRARGEAESLAGRVVVVGLQPETRRVLDLLGLGRVMRCVATRDEAIAYLMSAASPRP